MNTRVHVTRWNGVIPFHFNKWLDLESTEKYHNLRTHYDRSSSPASINQLVMPRLQKEWRFKSNFVNYLTFEFISTSLTTQDVRFVSDFRSFRARKVFSEAFKKIRARDRVLEAYIWNELLRFSYCAIASRLSRGIGLLSFPWEFFYIFTTTTVVYFGNLFRFANQYFRKRWGQADKWTRGWDRWGYWNTVCLKGNDNFSTVFYVSHL